MIYTIYNTRYRESFLESYMSSLIDMFFKIIPLREVEEPTLTDYMQSLQMELAGCSRLIFELGYDPKFLSLMSILQYLIDHPELDFSIVKREVFHAISICNNLKRRYGAYDEEV